MTQTPPEPTDRANLLESLVRIARSPATIAVGGTVIGVGIAGYLGIQYFVWEQLSPLLESQLSQILKREVRVGEVESFTLNSLRIGASEIPATPNDPDNLSFQSVEVKVNPLPLLIGRPVDIDVAIVEPNVYVDQDESGQWLNLEQVDLPETEGELPIPLDISVDLQGASLAVFPQGIAKPVTVQAAGTANYLKQDEQEIAFDLDAGLLGSQVTLEGNAIIETGKTQLNVSLDQLPLTGLAALIPNQPVKVKTGAVATDLRVNVPSLEAVEETQGNGNFNLELLEAAIAPLKDPIKANLELSFAGQQIKVEQGQASLGKVVAQLQGSLGWEEGYNLDVKVKPFRVQDLTDTVAFKLPVQVGGEFQTQVALRGNIFDPKFKGNFSNTKPLRVEKTFFKTLKADFQGDLAQATLSQLQIVPSSGGQLSGKGQIKTGIKQAITDNKPLDWQKMTLDFQLQGELPAGELVDPYYRLPEEYAVDTLATRGKVTGTLGKPQAKLDWQLAGAGSQGTSGSGSIRVAGTTLRVQDTRIATAGGAVKVEGDASLKSKGWQVGVEANTLNLTPFLAPLCQGNCPSTVIETANIRSSGRIDQLNIGGIRGVGNALVSLDNRPALNSSFTIQNAALEADANIARIGLNPFVPQLAAPVAVTGGQVNVSGSLNQLIAGNTLNFAAIQSSGNVGVSVNNQAAVNSQFTLQNAQFQSSTRLNPIAVNPLVPALAVPVIVTGGQVNLSGSLNQLITGNDINLQALTGRGFANVAVDNRPAVNAAFTLEQARLNARGTASQIPINDLLPDLAIPARLVSSQFAVGADLRNFSINSPLDLPPLQGNADAQLAIADGTVRTKAQLNNNQWQADVLLNAIDTRELGLPIAQRPGNTADAGVKVASTDLSQLITLPSSTDFRANGRVLVAGTLPTSLTSDFPVQVKSAALTALGQNVKASGDLTLANLTTIPAIANLSLDVNADSDLTKLPVNYVLDQLPTRPLLPLQLAVAGNAQFNGRLSIANCPLTPPIPCAPNNDVQLNGNVQLANFGLNDRKFEPLLAGTLNADLGGNIALNLQGKEDRIAASLDPCNLSQCLIPYLPTAFELRQTYGEQPPLIAYGQRQGAVFNTTVEKFDLAWLNLNPSGDPGILRLLEGQVAANLTVNLSTWESNGKLSLRNPTVGLLEKEKIEAEFSYQDSVIRIPTALMQLEDSRYELAAALNLNNGDIDGNVEVKDGRLEHLTALVKNADLQSLPYLLGIKASPKGVTTVIQPDSRGDSDASLAAQLETLAEVDEKIQKAAQELHALGIPNQLDLEGEFQFNAQLGGNIADPTVDLQLQGDRWAWYPQRPFPNILPPLGLVLEEQEFIPINNLVVKASYQDGQLQLEPASINIQGAQLAASGSVSLAEANLAWEIKDLSFDTVGNFVTIPGDIAGQVQAAGTITGSPLNPKLLGQYQLTNVAVNANLLGETIGGQIAYENALLTLQVSEPNSIKLKATAPFPILPGSNDQFDIQLQLGTEAIALIGPLSQEQLTWQSGEAQLNFQAKGRIKPDFSKITNFQAGGEVLLQEAVVGSPIVKDSVNVSGKISFTPEAINVEQLTGDFAQSEFQVAGVLPIITPLSQENPNAASPLTVAIADGQVDIESLYRGKVGGNIVVNGTLLTPVVSGNVGLSDGKVIIPVVREQVVKRFFNLPGQSAAVPVKKWLEGLETDEEAPVAFNPQVDNLMITLSGLSVGIEPLYRFEFGGELTVNGAPMDFNSLRADGAILVDRGIVNLFETRFLVDRRQPNSITFVPDQELLNPNLDIKMRTVVSALSETFRQRDEWTNSIPDDSLNKVQRIDINLGIKGPLSQLLPDLAQGASDTCHIASQGPAIKLEATITEAEYEQLSKCFQTMARQGDSEELLLNNPVISLTSRPSRSEGEIIRLLSEQVFALAEVLQGGSTEQLIRAGIVQLGFAMVFQSLLYDIESSISNAVGTADFRLSPFLEPIYQVGPQEYVRLRYDYSFNEVRLEYERQF